MVASSNVSPSVSSSLPPHTCFRIEFHETSPIRMSRLLWLKRFQLDSSGPKCRSVKRRRRAVQQEAGAPTAPQPNRIMEASQAECFLSAHRCRLVERVRNVDSLVDFLSEPRSSDPSLLSKEMASKIRAQETKEAKIREVYNHLNSTRGWELTLQWLKHYEPDVIKELENSSETDSEAPARKRCRSSAEAVDQTDSGLAAPSFVRAVKSCCSACWELQ
ncbi:hypothetical protein SRHO_G00063670 [Serrasalmus rhombeus]